MSELVIPEHNDKVEKEKKEKKKIPETAFINIIIFIKALSVSSFPSILCPGCINITQISILMANG